MNIHYSKEAKLPTSYGDFSIVSFRQEDDPHEHCLLFKGMLTGSEDVLTRVHSECLTGDVFMSRKCDCGEQLDESMRAIAEKRMGIIIYLRQEGRGIGLFNKINAYALQDQGQDTIEANHSLGFETDLRNFDIVADVVKHLGIKSITLLTNNPEKIDTLRKSGINVTKVMPSIIKPNEHNAGYLKTKKDVLNHAL